MRFRFRNIIVAGFFALIATLPMSVAANGGQLRVDQQQLGPYIVSVTTNPVPLRAGRIDVSVLVGDPANGSYLENADIVVEAESLDHEGVSTTHTASHEQATEARYQAAEFNLQTSGRWLFTVTVSGPDGGGTTSFEAEAAAAKGSDWIPVVIVVLILPIGIGLIWFVFHKRRSPEGDDAVTDDLSS